MGPSDESRADNLQVYKQLFDRLKETEAARSQATSAWAQSELAMMDEKQKVAELREVLRGIVAVLSIYNPTSIIRQEIGDLYERACALTEEEFSGKMQP